MSLKHGDVNPLNVHGLRQLQHNPPHFSIVTFDLRTDIKVINAWVYENLEGRFWSGAIFSRMETGRLTMKNAISFEIPAEASLFSMVLPDLNKRN